jgi:FkbM family methyltransferase
MHKFYAQFIPPGALCFDIGAHVGNRLRVWSGLGARMIAVEPQPSLMVWLQRLYGSHSSITLLEQAVGAQPGSATLYISSRTPTVTSMSQEWISAVQRDSSFSQVAWDKTVTVPVTTFDELIATYGLPAFCKIDVEGFELDVLRGLSQPVAVLSFEYIPAAMTVAVGCIERLEQLGRYEFNYSPGERHELQAPIWLCAAEMKIILARLNKGSGDVYARLVS